MSKTVPTCRRYRILYLGAVLSAFSVSGGPVFGDENKELEARLERLEEVNRQQQAQLEAQREQLAEQSRLIQQLLGVSGEDGRSLDVSRSPSGEAATAEATPPVTPAHSAVGSPVVADTSEPAAQSSEGQGAAVAELRRQQSAGTSDDVDARATLYDPATSIYDENFVGAWHLPGTTAAMRIGGYVNVTLVNSFNPVLVPDRFIVGSIPPSGLDIPGAESGTTVTANQSRLNYEVRQETSGGQLRAFIEGDFEGEGDTFRLRHAYGQYRSVLVGKTNTAFSDPKVSPEEVDFEGINGMVLLRQSQLRFFPKLNSDLNLVVSLEDTATDVQNGTGVSGNFPDTVLKLNRLPLGRLGSWNYQVAFIARDLESTGGADGAQIEGNPAFNSSTSGWGFTTSGQLPVTRWGDDDFFSWQVTYGKGIGRYINDLGTIGGGDAVIDPATGQLHALPVWAGFLSYTHTLDPSWSRLLSNYPGIWRSTFTFSWVDINNFEFEEPLSYNTTYRASGNLLYYPTQKVRLGFEFMWGKRINKDDSEGTATQLQMSARYSF